ncbi:MAG TPA: c-type cytochrome, partial [Pirellulales bacterium]|nr:c-type cytochrome [Pirellulales bacterium]
MRHSCLIALLILSTVHVTQAAKPKLSATARTGATSHPVVPAFERFDPNSKDAEPKADTIDRGRLLLGELNCTACHEADASTRGSLVPKQAPVLSDVGQRVKPEWLRELLNNPRHAKPGTTMPHVLARLKPEERTRQVEALVHFLVSTGDKPPADQAPNRQSAERGEKLFHQAGCVACHAPRKDDAPALSTSVPLGDPGAKYSIPTLAKFLRDPLAVRPSGRMPNLNLTIDEGYDLAHYFLRDVTGTPPNMNYEYFEGDFRMVDFGQKGSKTTGTCLGFDLGLARRSEQYAFRFTGFLRIAKKGTYTLYATSDDGSRVEVDGQTVVNHDGCHAASTKSGEVTLDAGMHELTVEYFNNEKDATLEVEIEGPDLPRGDVTRLVSLTEDAAPPETKDTFHVDEQLAAEGRKLFATAGCASCHELRASKETKAIASSLKAPRFSGLDVEKGCLAEAPKGHAPNFGLNSEQRKILRKTVRAKPQAKKGAAERDDTIVQSMAAFNCVACHARDGWGGIESARNGYFVTTIPEMGDEGRVPPPLSGVGGKLTMSWMRSTVDKGAKSRP